MEKLCTSLLLKLPILPDVNLNGLNVQFLKYLGSSKLETHFQFS